MTPALSSSAGVALALLGDHLWQSTVVAAVAGLLTLTLKRNRADVRAWVWFVALVKFLVPFGALLAIGRQFSRYSSTTIVQPDMTVLIDAISQPFSQPNLGPAVIVTPSTTSSFPAAATPLLLLAVWLVGCALILTVWVVRWRRVAAAVRNAVHVEHGRDLDTLRRLEQLAGIKKPLAMVSSHTSLEPGVFGIVHPVLLWSQRIGEHLSEEQVGAILAHEVCHVRRRDNLVAAIQMFVEAVFWFHPLVWWLGARQVDERERACDEEVIRQGSEPQVYAESIVKICEFYIESPLDCVAGVTGSDLKKRIEAIMRNDARHALTRGKKVLLATAGLLAIALPVAIGVVRTPRLQAQSAAVAVDGQASQFEVASIKPNKSDSNRVNITSQGGRFTATNVSLVGLIRIAYGNPRALPLDRLSVSAKWMGGPGQRYVESDRFDVVAKAEGVPSPEQMNLMLRALLADRFKLIVHHETRELPSYALMLVRSDGRFGPRLRRSDVDCSDPDNEPPPAADGTPSCGFRSFPGKATGRVTMSALAQRMLVNALDDRRPVEDRTGLAGTFEFDLEWTPDRPSPSRPADAPPAPPIDPNGASIFTALREQLGLKLEPSKGQIDIVVVDHAEQPTSDDALLKTVPLTTVAAQPRRVQVTGPAFEVASVKPNKSGETRNELDLPAGRFTARNVPLKDLILIAFGVRDVQLFGGPNWINSDRFDINAKADIALTPVTVGPYLRQLLIDRFKLKTRNETREIPIYALVAARSDGKLGPELRRPEMDYCAATLARQQRGQPPEAPQPGQPARCLMRGGAGTLTARSMPIASLAGRLAALVNRFVVDRTSLEGVFDLDLAWTPDQPSPNPDSNGPSIFTALQEQLGLKLESTRGPVEVLVIDRVEQPMPD